MNHGGVQSSPPQQTAAAAATWWSSNNTTTTIIRPPPHHHQLELPLSCSQLLLAELVGEDKESGLRRLENWEQQHLLTLTNSSDLKHPHNNLSPDQCNSINSAITGGAAKKARIQPPSLQSTFKVKKEKLGDKITALHRLVSPFGKTDTASVLLEAIGYIRFLHTQIEALSLPYLHTRHHLPGSNGEPKADLRSRGLCLVPTSCTLQVGSDNGADFWPAPAACDANLRF
ncbi:transcription factor bHLH133-like [Andrographis paniculata]|uniref:transcription factor bHLH133-like n=1 Tax=Andrographis paniculata TaxID=175694 RepID=UPI0021E759D9|nr:transcription factor bHLH133-like [Andrographis paniculata]